MNFVKKINIIVIAGLLCLFYPMFSQYIVDNNAVKLRTLIESINIDHFKNLYHSINQLEINKNNLLIFLIKEIKKEEEYIPQACLLNKYLLTFNIKQLRSQNRISFILSIISGLGILGSACALRFNMKKLNHNQWLLDHASFIPASGTVTPAQKIYEYTEKENRLFGICKMQTYFLTSCLSFLVLQLINLIKSNNQLRHYERYKKYYEIQDFIQKYVRSSIIIK